MKAYKKSAILLIVSLLLTAVPISSRAEEKTMQLTIEEAIQLGIQNSIQLKMVKNQIDISSVGKTRAREINRDLDNGQNAIWDGNAALYRNTDLLRMLESLPPEQLEALGYTPQAIQQMRNSLEQGKQKLDSGEKEFNQALQKVEDRIAQKLGMESSYDVGTYNTKKMLEKMSEVSYDVTQASYDIYKNQIALLIQKSYYDVLKAQKLVQVKEKALERGKKQYEFAKDSYEEGMKAKDDLLLAKLYYQGTQLEYIKSKGELNNALIEFKKNLHIPFDTEVTLTDVLAEKIEIPVLDKG
ncbi:MAG: TolC family protein, partial [Thermotaleaceae bacterium]